MTKRLLVFDLDGTLINSKDDIIRSFNQSFRKNQSKKIDEKYFIKNANRGSRFFIKKNLKKDELHKLKKINLDFQKYYKQNCTKTTKARFGVKFFLNWSSKRFINVISTNKPKYLSIKIIKSLGLSNYIDNIFGVDTLKYNKPNPKHLKKILDIYKIKENQCVFFGDSEIDWKMSKKLGVDFFLISKGYLSKKIKINRNNKIKNFFEAKKKLLSQ